MYITNKQFEALRDGLELLPHGLKLAELDRETQAIITAADIAMDEIKLAKANHNATTAAYIRNRRKSDKNYCR